MFGSRCVAYWSERGPERLQLLNAIVANLNEKRCGEVIDTGWERWDIQILCHPWAVARIATAQEEHGQEKRLIRVRYEVRPSGYTQLLLGLTATICGLGIVLGAWPVATVGGVLFAICGALYWHGTGRAAGATSLVDSIAADLGFVRCNETTDTASMAPHSARRAVPENCEP